MLYLVAYDIAHPKRLRRVARVMEKWGTRCQKSVFMVRGGRIRLKKVLQAVHPLIDPRMDVVQAWQLALEEVATGWVLGMAPLVCPASVVIAGPTMYSIQRTDSPHQRGTDR